MAAKDALKARRYRWNPGTDGRPKAWFKELSRDDLAAELAWLTAEVYDGTLPKLRQDPLDAKTRYSDRV
jgi:DNA polymerase-3 subunit epsilon